MSHSKRVLKITIMIVNIVYAYNIHYEYINTRKNWNEANLFCKNHRNGVLADLSDLNVTNLVEDTWINRFRIYTQWIRISGCYKLGSLILQTYPLSLSNSVRVCQILCKSNYIALDEKKCSCLTSKPADDLIEFNCNTTCPGEVTDYCGFNYGRLSSLYKIENIPDITTFAGEDATLCAAYNYEDGTLRLYQRRCTDQFKIVCKSYRQNIPFVLPGSETWTEARKICQSSGYDLADDIAITTVPNGLTEGDNFWIGLFRRDITDNISENNSEKVSKICSYYNVSTGIVSYLSWTKCEDLQMPFTCRINHENISFSTIKSTTEIDIFTTGEVYNTTYDDTILNESDIAGIVIGCVVGFFLVTVVMIVLICVLLRKRKTVEENSASEVDQVTSQRQIRSSDHSMVKLNRDPNSLNDREVYADLCKGEYDVLNKTRKKIENTERDAVYNHANTACSVQDIYDHTRRNSGTIGDSADETYDNCEDCKDTQIYNTSRLI